MFLVTKQKKWLCTHNLWAQSQASESLNDICFVFSSDLTEEISALEEILTANELTLRFNNKRKNLKAFCKNKTKVFLMYQLRELKAGNDKKCTYRF